MIYIIRKDSKVLANLMNDLGNLSTFKTWKIEIKEHNGKRSNNANALYWKWLTIIGDHLGYESDELHDELRLKFLGVEDKETKSGKLFQVLKSTTELNKKQFSVYMNKIHTLGMMYELKLPQPDYYGLERINDKQK